MRSVLQMAGREQRKPRCQQLCMPAKCRQVTILVSSDTWMRMCRSTSFILRSCKRSSRSVHYSWQSRLAAGKRRSPPHPRMTVSSNLSIWWAPNVPCQELMSHYHPEQSINGMNQHSMKPRAKKFTIYDLDDKALDLIRDFYKEV